MNRLFIKFTFITQVPSALGCIILTFRNWIFALVCYWMSFAILLRAMCVFRVFLIFLTEIISTYSVPNAVLSVVWSSTTMDTVVFCYGTEGSSTVIECWIGMANCIVAVGWNTILARFCRFYCLVPASW